jgi:hypothetical protein
MSNTIDTMRIDLESPEGIRLLTKDKACSANIDVIPVLQTKTAIANGTYTADDGFAGIGEMFVDVPTDTTEEWDGSFTVEGEPTTGDEGLILNGIIKQYKVNAGENVNAGDFVEFVNKWGSGEFSTASSHITACKLDENKVLVAYRDVGSKQGTAVVLTISGTSVTVGTPTVIHSKSTEYIRLATLSNNKVFCAYYAYTNSAYDGLVSLFTIDGTSISATEGEKLSTSSLVVWSAVALSDSKVLLCTSAGSSVCTISGTTITNGTFTTSFKGVSTMSAVALSDSKVLAVYGDDGNSNYGTAVVLTVNGTSVTVGTKKVFKSAAINGISAVALANSKVLVTYCNSDGSIYGTAVVLTVNGSTVTVATAHAFSNAVTSSPKIIALSENKALVAYRDGSQYGTAVVLTVDGSTVSNGSSTIFNSGSTAYIDLVAISSNSAFAVYDADGVSRYTSLVVDGTTITCSDESGTFVKPATSALVPTGVAKTSGAEGETVEVYCVPTNEGV